MKKNPRNARLAAVGALLATGTVGALAFSGLANAADSSTTVVSTAAASTAASSGSSSTGSTDAAPARRTETALAGDDLAKATAAAATAVPGATIVRAETDADGAAYEVHVTKADGTSAVVELNSDFTVKSIGADQGGAPSGPHQANGITEAPLTGDDLAKATAAADTAAPGSTVVRAETDADGDSFEVHITKADGTQATVKLNSDFTVKTVEAGGPGGAGGRGHGGPRGGQAPAAGSADGSTATTN